jgi:hypothetical protein
MKVTVEFDPTSPIDFERARTVLAKFTPPTTDADTPAGAPRANGFALPATDAAATDDEPLRFELLWDRIGENAWNLLSDAARMTEPGESFTFRSLADKFADYPYASLKAHYRNLTRTMQSLGDKAPKLFTTSWDGTRRHYTLTDAARAAIEGRFDSPSS